MPQASDVCLSPQGFALEMSLSGPSKGLTAHVITHGVNIYSLIHILCRTRAVPGLQGQSETNHSILFSRASSLRRRVLIRLFQVSAIRGTRRRFGPQHIGPT